MSDLVVIVYPSEAKAEEVRQRLLSLQKEYLITINDAVIAVKGADGNVKLNQLVNTTAIGAASGSFWLVRVIRIAKPLSSSARRRSRRMFRWTRSVPTAAARW